MPERIDLEPANLPQQYAAGADIAETAVVILNGAGQKVVKGYLGGKKHLYGLSQRLWFCPTGQSHKLHPSPKTTESASRCTCVGHGDNNHIKKTVILRPSGNDFQDAKHLACAYSHSPVPQPGMQPLPEGSCEARV